MTDKNNTQSPQYPDPSLTYNETWLVRQTFIGGLMLALGSYYLPAIYSDNSLQWFWNIPTGIRGTPLDIIRLVLILCPLIMIKVVPRNILAISLLSFLGFSVVSNFPLDLINIIKEITAIANPNSPSPWGNHLTIYLILTVFILSTLCKALQREQHPVILLRFTSALLLILLTIAVVNPFVSDDSYFRSGLHSRHSILFILTSFVYVLAGLSQSFRQAPAFVVNILFFVLLAIVLHKMYLIAVMSESALLNSLNTLYLFAQRLIAIGGILILLRCSIIMSCIQYTGRKI